jgi:hypothetical protein
MKISSFFMLKAIVCFVFGIGSAVIPTTMWPIYGITLDPNGILMARFCGACLIGIGLILWLAKNSDWNALKGITLSLCVADLIGFIVALGGQLAGIMNSLGWIVVIIWLFFALGLGYFRFLKPSTS